MRTASQLRQIARQRLDGKWGTSLAVSLLAALLGCYGTYFTVSYSVDSTGELFDGATVNLAALFRSLFGNNLRVPAPKRVKGHCQGQAKIHEFIRKLIGISAQDLPCLPGSRAFFLLMSAFSQAQIEGQEEARCHRRRTGENDGAPIHGGAAGNKRNLFHLLTLLPVQPWQSR